jgi:hypothetical protein
VCTRVLEAVPRIVCHAPSRGGVHADDRDGLHT